MSLPELDGLSVISRGIRAVVMREQVNSQETCAYRLMDLDYPVYKRAVAFRADSSYFVVRLRNSMYLRGVELLSENLPLGVQFEAFACNGMRVPDDTTSGSSDDNARTHRGRKRRNRCSELRCKRELLLRYNGNGELVREFSKIVCNPLVKKIILATYLNFTYSNKNNISLNMYKISILGILSS